MSGWNIKRIIISLTLVLFAAIYAVMITAGISNVRHLFSVLIASYLVVWGGYALLSTVPREEIRNQFVLMTIALGVALLLVELPAVGQLIDFRRTFSTSGSLLGEEPGYLPDSELVSKPEPYRAVKMEFSRGNIGEVLCLPPHPAEPFDLHYDKNGFRNDEDLTSADIAVIGDSYVESPMLHSALLSTTRLAKVMQQTVANLGQSGYGPQQELAVLKRYALPLHPKSVVWVFYEGNDLRDAERYADRISRLKSNWDIVDAVWDRSFTRNSLFWLTRMIHGCNPVHAAKEVITRAVVVGPEQKKHLVYLKGRSSSVGLTKQELDALKTSVTTIKEAYRLVREDGGRVLVAFAPTAFRVYHDVADFTEAGEEIPQWDLNDLPDRLRRMISEISPDIDYLDLTSALKAAAKRNTLVFFADDTHWSSDGHQVVSEALAEALAKGPVYAEQPRRAQGKTNKDSILSSGVIMVRNLDGTIRYWSEGAKKLYGWESQDALGTTSHQLLKTVFPVPLENIEETLRVNGHWEGRLIHERRNGSKVIVGSRWDLQQNPQAQDRSITIVEVNDPSKS
ncbi:MAG: PAS domain S-box protein [Nitrospira sp.]